MKLIPYLVNIQEDRRYNDYNILPKELKEYAEISKHNFYRISNIDYLDQQYFKKGTNLGNGVWTIYTHYKVDNKYYQLALKPELSDDESIDDYVLSFKSNSIDNKSFNILRYIESEGVFIDTPRYTRHNIRIETKNIFDTAGYVSLEIKNIKTNIIQTIPIRVLPSSIDYEDYIEMIEDLISIREDIITTDCGKVGIGKKWGLKRDNFVNCIDNIYNHIIQINNNPSSKLSLENTKVSYSKMKKIKPKTIIEKSMYPYKDKYTTTIGKEDLNIYENQIIKYSLIQIKEKIEKYKEQFEKNINYNERHLEKLKNDIEDIWDEKVEYKKDELEKYVVEVEKNIKDIVKYANKNSGIDREKIDKHISEMIYLKFKIGININENSKPKINLNYNKTSKEFKLQLETDKFDNVSRKFDYDLLDRKIKFRHLNQNEIYNGKFGKNRKILFEFNSKNVNKIKFLYDALTNANNNILDLVIIAKRKNYKNENPLLPIYYNLNSTFETFTIQCEDLVSINNMQIPNYTEKQIREFLEVKMYNLNLENSYEKLGFIQSLDSDFEELETIRYDFYKGNTLEQTLDKIDKLLNIKFIKDIKVKKDILKPTQIFINDFSYNKVFRELKKLNKKVRFLDSISPDMYFLKTTADIYENWCLYKIVNVLTNELGWILSNKESVLKDIDKLLKHTGKFDKPCVKIELEHNIKNNEKLTLDLIYEGKIYYDENKYKTPDFQFIFRSKTIGERRIYLDAKYRNYKEQGNSTFLKDINNVAIGKYYVPFIHTPNISDVSFIVHSDKDERFECFGGNHIIEDYKIKDIYKDNQLLEYVVPNNHRFGAFYLLPSYSFNINKFLRMILEYHLGMYNMCWSCGEVEDIKVEEKKTAGGYIKYHYTCNKCDEFWVKNHCRTPQQHKLIKHIDNYHYINKDKKDPWYVTCPICFNGMEKEYIFDESIPF